MCGLSCLLGSFSKSPFMCKKLMLEMNSLAHRIRDMQTLPYVVVTNPHISQVYELYYKAFESLRRIREIKTLEDNERLCKKISQTLQEHLTVIPKLAMGVIECRDLMKPEDMDKFMNTVLRSVCPLYISTTFPCNC
jgi:hypothetical protein